MAHFAIRHFVNELQGEYQSRGEHLPLLYASYASLKKWLGDGYRVDGAWDLLELYLAETVAFWNRFERLFSRVFPLEWGILGEALLRAREQCATLHRHDLALSARDVAVHFVTHLREVKEEVGYDNDREECRARYEELVEQVTELHRTTSRSREQALYHLLPRR
jgi:hypothetical protein